MTIIQTARHSKARCMNCSSPPDIDVRWADGRARAWFCRDCFAEWVKNYWHDSVVGAWLVEGDEVGDTPSDSGKRIYKMTEDYEGQKIVEVLDHMLTERGGPGSGNYGHQGLAGVWGGSSPRAGDGVGGGIAASPSKRDVSSLIDISNEDIEAAMSEMPDVGEISFSELMALPSQHSEEGTRAFYQPRGWVSPSGKIFDARNLIHPTIASKAVEAVSGVTSSSLSAPSYLLIEKGWLRIAGSYSYYKDEWEYMTFELKSPLSSKQKRIIADIVEAHHYTSPFRLDVYDPNKEVYNITSPLKHLFTGDATREQVLDYAQVDRSLTERGGPGSGNYGHQGLAGVWGGSSKRGGSGVGDGVGGGPVAVQDNIQLAQLPSAADYQGDLQDDLTEMFEEFYKEITPAQVKEGTSTSKYFEGWLNKDGRAFDVGIDGHIYAAQNALAQVLGIKGGGLRDFEREIRKNGVDMYRLMFEAGFVRFIVNPSHVDFQIQGNAPFTRAQREFVEDLHFYRPRDDMYFEVYTPEGDLVSDKMWAKNDWSPFWDAVKRSLTERGGPGSGNFGHAGRPGKVGGSAPRGDGVGGGEAVATDTEAGIEFHVYNGSYGRTRDETRADWEHYIDRFEKAWGYKNLFPGLVMTNQPERLVKKVLADPSLNLTVGSVAYDKSFAMLKNRTRRECEGTYFGNGNMLYLSTQYFSDTLDLDDHEKEDIQRQATEEWTVYHELGHGIANRWLYNVSFVQMDHADRAEYVDEIKPYYPKDKWMAEYTAELIATSVMGPVKKGRYMFHTPLHSYRYLTPTEEKDRARLMAEIKEKMAYENYEAISRAAGQKILVGYHTGSGGLYFRLIDPAEFSKEAVFVFGDESLIERGGSGSGNFGHAGRPGKVGGSAPRGGSALAAGADGIIRIDGHAQGWDATLELVDQALDQTKAENGFGFPERYMKGPVDEWRIFTTKEAAIDYFTRKYATEMDENLIVIDDSGAVVSNKGGRDNVTFSKRDQLTTFESENPISIHNHPTYGDQRHFPPSPDDFLLAMRTSQAGFIVTGLNGYWKITPNGSERFDPYDQNEFIGWYNKYVGNPANWEKNFPEKYKDSWKLPDEDQHRLLFGTLDFPNAMGAYQADRNDWIGVNSDLFTQEWVEQKHGK